TGDMDYSEIRASALARFWRELLALVAELALEPKLEPAEVDVERGFLLSRIQKRRDNAPARAFDELYAALYAPHPYALPVLGTPESLARIDHAARAEEALRREVERIQREAIGAEELRRAKGYLLGRYVMDRRTNERQAWYLAFYELEGQGRDYPARFRGAVEAVTASDVQRVARQYLS